MTDQTARERRNAIRAEYTAEETETAEAEAVEAEQAVLSVRIPADLAEALTRISTQLIRPSVRAESIKLVTL